ncbi:MAG: glycosyltransferase family 2 protein [Candidatus Cloacimonadaceae bacterium]|nr:glycosyltransferase family 2 protein [Candidatus Cloacimonadaceae bacterium]
MLDVSAFVLTQNSERTIKACLESVQWCDSVVLIDSFSEDDTLNIAKAYENVIIHQHQYTNAREQRTWGMRHVQTQWVFIIDSDEYCPPNLRDKILSILQSSDTQHDGYLFMTRTIFMGKLLTHQDYLSSYGKRLVHTNIATRYWRNTRVHASIRLDNKKYIARKYYLVHNPIASFSQHISKASKYAMWQAQDMYDNNKKAYWWHFVLRPGGKFLRHYLINGGWRDGMQGFVICALGASCVFLKFLYLKELWSHESR